MIDISSIVFTRLTGGNSQLGRYLKGSGTSYKATPAEFPYLYLRTLGQPTSASDLENHQKAIIADFEITIYTTDSSSNARKLLYLAGDIMMSMGFKLTTGPYEIENVAGTGVYRWLAHFSRMVADGDKI